MVREERVCIKVELDEIDNKTTPHPAAAAAVVVVVVVVAVVVIHYAGDNRT